jgi:hypothetical protein
MKIHNLKKVLNFINKVLNMYMNNKKIMFNLLIN